MVTAFAAGTTWALTGRGAARTAATDNTRSIVQPPPKQSNLSNMISRNERSSIWTPLYAAQSYAVSHEFATKYLRTAARRN